MNPIREAVVQGGVARILVVALALGVSGCRKAESRPLASLTSAVPASSGARTPLPEGAGSGGPVEGAPRAPGFSEVTWRYDATPLGPSEVVVLVPRAASTSARMPVLVAFHGRGESLKGPHLGARGWADDYAIGRAAERLGAAPLTAADFLDFVTPGRLARLNRALAEEPYRGVILVCPFLPDGLHGARMVEEGRGLARFVADELLPRVFRETPAMGTMESTGVDGVSLGGRAALLVGLLRPEAFGVVAALQPAVDDAETDDLAELAKSARAKNPKLVLRLLSSDGDYFLEPTTTLSHALSSRGLTHQLDVVTGPHSYEFNRGPGAYEMLLFHDRVLRGRAAP